MTHAAPKDIEWLEPIDDNYCPPVTPFVGTKVALCLDNNVQSITLTPSSFPLVLVIDVGGVSKVIRIEEK